MRLLLPENAKCPLIFLGVRAAAADRQSHTERVRGEMRFVSFEKNGKVGVGMMENDLVVDLSIAAPDLPGSLKEIIAFGVPADLTKKVAAAPATAKTPDRKSTRLNSSH